MGDRILKVNGTDVTTATHQEAVMELLRPGDDIKLFVQHDPLPLGFLVLINFFHNVVFLNLVFLQSKNKITECRFRCFQAYTNLCPVC